VGVIMALFYFFIIEWGERLITPHSEKILTLGLFITMSLLLSLFIKERQKIKYSGGLTLTRAIILGITQGITLLPVGISRFASTYVIFRWLNVSPRRAFEISFLFYFPLVTAGTIKGMFSLYFSHNLAQMLTPTLLSVYFFSGLIALLGFWFMYKIALNKKLSWVGIYMIIPLSIMGFLIFKK
jgi:undecaprenyl pyrophosphate phosphatase UppP